MKRRSERRTPGFWHRPAQRGRFNIVRTLSKQGVCSRKQAVAWVLEGRVQVNGQTVRDPGRKILDTDRISVDEEAVARKRKIYILLNKPAGYVTTRQDEKGRKTVYDLLKEIPSWVFPVGRLDQDSEGLLLFTNDTALGEQLTNPHYKIPKTYRVRVEGLISDSDLSRLRGGMAIGRGEHTRPAQAEVIKQEGDSTWLELTLVEGKNREVRRMFEILGKPVLNLLRTRMGPFHLGNLRKGEWRELDNVKPVSVSGPPADSGSRNPSRRTPGRFR